LRWGTEPGPPRTRPAPNPASSTWVSTSRAEGNVSEDVPVGVLDNGGHDRAIAPFRLTVGSEIGATKGSGRCSPNQIVPLADPLRNANDQDTPLGQARLTLRLRVVQLQVPDDGRVVGQPRPAQRPARTCPSGTSSRRATVPWQALLGNLRPTAERRKGRKGPRRQGHWSRGCDRGPIRGALTDRPRRRAARCRT